MTTPPLVAPERTPLYDIELEQLMDDEATCELDDKPCKFVIGHIGHTDAYRVCAEHEARLRAAVQHGFPFFCARCGTHDIPCSDITIRPV